MKLSFYKYQTEIRSLFKKLLSTYPPKNAWRPDVDSILWNEQNRRNLNVFSEYLEEGAKGLDAGCGRGLYSAMLSQMGFKMKATDQELPFEEQMRYTKKNWQKEGWNYISKNYGVSFKICDLRKKLPYKDNEFDFIMLYAVLEHVIPRSKIKDVLKNISRVLKKGGYVFVADLPSVDSYVEKLAVKLGMWSHREFFTKNDLIKYFGKNYRLVYWSLYDMLPRHYPSFVDDINNILFPATFLLDWILIHSPFKKFAHHHIAVFQKKHNHFYECTKKTWK